MKAKALWMIHLCLVTLFAFAHCGPNRPANEPVAETVRSEPISTDTSNDAATNTTDEPPDSADPTSEEKQGEDTGVAEHRDAAPPETPSEPSYALTLSSIEPKESYLWGGEATLQGKDLLGDGTEKVEVLFGGIPAKILSTAQGVIKVQIPKRTEPQTLNVSVKRGTLRSNPLAFQYIRKKPTQFDYGPAITNEEVDLFLEEMTKLYPERTRKWSIGKTHEQRDIWALKIAQSPDKDDNDKIQVLFTSGLHAREQAPVYMLMRWIKDLLERYQTDKDIKEVMDQSEIYIVLVANPDGRSYDLSDGRTRGWRTNRRVTPGSVDLNRNSSYRWGALYQNGVGSVSKDPRTETYRGPHSFSEPETQALRKLIQEKRFQLWLDNHSTAHTLYGLKYVAPYHLKAYDSMQSGFSRAQHTPYLMSPPFATGDSPPGAKQRRDAADIPGLLTSWAYYAEGVIGITLEFPRRGDFYPSEEFMANEYKMNVRGAYFFLLAHACHLPKIKRKTKPEDKVLTLENIKWLDSKGQAIKTNSQGTNTLTFDLRNNGPKVIEGLRVTLLSTAAGDDVSVDTEYQSGLPALAPSQSITVAPSANSGGLSVRFHLDLSVGTKLPFTLYVFDKEDNRWEFSIMVEFGK